MSLKKDRTKLEIIKELYISRSLSCSDLCERRDKSLPLITKLVNELLEDEVIVESGFAASTGGRRPLMYSIRPDFQYVIAVSMDQLITRIALMDMHNNYIGAIVKVNLPLKGNNHALLELTTAIASFIQNSPIKPHEITGIGIAMPGFINPAEGINYSFLQAGDNIVAHLEQKLGIPVFIDNDSSLIALAELRFGAAVQERNAMVINMGWGVGLGMIIDGALYRGEIGFAGEFSHIPIFNNNKLCSCGKYGCLETETSLLVLVENARKGIEKGCATTLNTQVLSDPEEANHAIIRAALNGDKFAVELLSEIGLKIGRGVSILIHLLNPKLIVLSGRGAMAGKIWQAPIQQALNKYCIPRLADNTVIKVSELGYQAEMIGAAALVMENFEQLHLTKFDATTYKQAL
ncbi:ROK family protein [Haliscomenobacter hydrossis]|uniref:Glucokinase n=1 Tax=Haliscomenobacter hydrossis (strain ATCC 27775 / DSM 1100 / LMG 10767 / O) TaxID=760192 RepID=F4KXC1_HALH1|nr:ROK family protein [Haliscomenobacter hydrossis]AEE49329.1 Glucokinase [Haliscomenobacter hydrossis DSM 1100]